MGTHPIFESDFDCLTEWIDIRILGRWGRVGHVANSACRYRLNKVAPSGRLTSSLNFQILNLVNQVNLQREICPCRHKWVIDLPVGLTYYLGSFRMIAF